MGLLNKFRKDGKKKDYEEEVVSNLTSLFNTKRYFGAWQRELGLQNYGNINSYKGTIKEIISDIQYNIRHYERRIELLSIESMESDTPFTLRFQIKCKLGGKFHSFYVGFTNCQKTVLVEEEKDEV